MRLTIIHSSLKGSKESENAFEKCLPLLKPQDTVLLLMITVKLRN